MTQLNQPIRILHCVAGLGRGGYETFIMNVYRKIDRQKVQFDFLYSFDGVYVQEAKSLGARLFQIPFITQVGPFAYQKAVDKFLITHKEYTIVHSHMDKFSGLIMERCKKNIVPVRIAHSHSTQNEGGMAFQIVKNYYGNKIDKNCTHRLACSENAYNWLFKSNENKLVVKNGIDLLKYNLSDQRENNIFCIVHIGRFSKAKNHEFLLDIFAQAVQKDNTARLLLAGTGDLQQAIKTKANKLNLLNYVTFLNDVDDVPSLLQKADVLCMPSLFEGLGIALIEAQAAGVACVASDNIPNEAAVTESLTFLPLSASPLQWAQELLKHKQQPKKDYHKQISDKGYDINQTAMQLQQFYLENGNII